MLSSLFRTCQAPCIRGRPFLTSSLRRYATAPPPRQTPSTRSATPGQALASATAKRRPTAGNLNDMSKLRKIEYAEKLYNEGSVVLFRASGRLRAYRFQCYALAAVSFAAIYLNIHVDSINPEELKARGIPAFVAGAYLALGVFLMVAGNWAISRARGQIRSITLVKQLDQVFLEVTVTRRIPFLKQQVLVKPYDMIVDSRLVAMKNIPIWMVPRDVDESSPSAATASVIKGTFSAISRFFYNFVFSPAKQFFLREGILSIQLLHDNPNTQSKTISESFSLDTDGQFLSDAKGPMKDKQILFDLTTFQHPGQPRVG